MLVGGAQGLVSVEPLRTAYQHTATTGEVFARAGSAGARLLQAGPGGTWNLTLTTHDHSAYRFAGVTFASPAFSTGDGAYVAADIVWTARSLRTPVLGSPSAKPTYTSTTAVDVVTCPTTGPRCAGTLSIYSPTEGAFYSASRAYAANPGSKVGVSLTLTSEGRRRLAALRSEGRTETVDLRDVVTGTLGDTLKTTIAVKFG